MLTPERELDLLRFLHRLEAQLRQTQSIEKALGYSVRAAREFLRAGHGCVAVVMHGRPEAGILMESPGGGGWDLALLGAFIGERRPAIPDEMLVSPLRRHGLPWGALALRWPGRAIDRTALHEVNRIASAVSEAIDAIDRGRMLVVRDRIEKKTLEQIRPKDLYYHILDGVRSLTRYDHSSALLVLDDGAEALTLVAEQIAWTRGKSRRIGLKLPLAADARAALLSGVVRGFDRAEDAWSAWGGGADGDLARLLDYNRAADAEAGGPREAAMICAPLFTREGLLGVLKIAACRPGQFAPHEAAIVDGFRAYAAITIHNARRAEAVRARMLEAERRNAMAELASGVAHDVNNAIGSALPLVQQMREDARQGRVEPALLSEDLDQVEQSLQVARRIFGGMLSFARGAARGNAPANVARAVEVALDIVRDSLERRRVAIAVEMPQRLPSVACGQGDLEQVLLNLLTNARDAMPAGGSLTVRGREEGGAVAILVGDTGEGIPAEHLSRIQEPFFTTKPGGSGLGLAICRSILWGIGGTIGIESARGEGTRVRITLPVAPPERREEER